MFIQMNQVFFLGGGVNCSVF